MARTFKASLFDAIVIAGGTFFSSIGGVNLGASLLNEHIPAKVVFFISVMNAFIASGGAFFARLALARGLKPTNGGV